eukprot:jgi/Botrbrau1/15238/Bobra.0149s0091.1
MLSDVPLLTHDFFAMWALCLQHIQEHWKPLLGMHWSSITITTDICIARRLTQGFPWSESYLSGFLGEGVLTEVPLPTLGDNPVNRVITAVALALGVISWGFPWHKGLSQGSPCHKG